MLTENKLNYNLNERYTTLLEFWKANELLF